MKIWVYFHAYKNLYSLKKWETSEKFENNLKNKSFGFSKKKISSNTNTEIKPWFWFPLPKPGFCHTYIYTTPLTATNKKTNLILYIFLHFR